MKIFTMKIFTIRFLRSDNQTDCRIIESPTLARAWEVLVKNYANNNTATEPFPVAIITAEEQNGQQWQWLMEVDNMEVDNMEVVNMEVNNAAH